MYAVDSFFTHSVEQDRAATDHHHASSAINRIQASPWERRWLEIPGLSQGENARKVMEKPKEQEQVATGQVSRQSNTDQPRRVYSLVYTTHNISPYYQECIKASIVFPSDKNTRFFHGPGHFLVSLVGFG